MQENPKLPFASDWQEVWISFPTHTADKDNNHVMGYIESITLQMQEKEKCALKTKSLEVQRGRDKHKYDRKSYVLPYYIGLIYDAIWE